MGQVCVQGGNLVLPAAEAAILREVSEQAAACLRDEPHRLRTFLPELPAGVLGALTSFAYGGSALGYRLIRGLDVSGLPPTPRRAPDFWPHQSTGALALAAEALGELVGYADEKHGALIHDVVPVPGEEGRIENSGSVRFDFHTENVHHPLRPDFLFLLCLRQDHEGRAATRAASVRAAVQHLEAEQAALLRRPVYRSKFPSSFTRGGTAGEAVSTPHPVLFGPDKALFMRFNAHNTISSDRAGTEALRTLSRALDLVSHDLVLEPGDLLILDNHVAAHGRSAFTPRYDGHDRWLRRAYAVHSVPHWAREMSDRARVIPSVATIQGVL